jgi:hypothetical protein
VNAPDEELIAFSEGPEYWSHASRTAARGLIMFLPVLSVFGGIVILCAVRGWDWSPALVFGSIIAGLVVLVSLLIPTGQAQMRRRRDVLLGQLACSTSSSEARLCWTAWLLESGRKYDGSVHLIRGVLRFCWHQGPQTIIVDPRGEIVLEVPVASIAAVETEPAPSLREWWRCGSPLVLLILRDGRRIRIGAPQSEKLAQALRRRVGRPEGTPVAPSPADFTIEEIGQALVRRYPLVALIVKGDNGLPPHVVLHGRTEELRGALENARDATVQGRKALGPYALGLLPVDPRAKEEAEPLPDEGRAKESRMVDLGPS